MLFPLCLFVVALTLVGLAVLIRAAFAAPHGVEDERGFHLAKLPGDQTAKQVDAPASADLVFFHR